MFVRLVTMGFSWSAFGFLFLDLDDLETISLVVSVLLELELELEVIVSLLSSVCLFDDVLVWVLIEDDDDDDDDEDDEIEWNDLLLLLSIKTFSGSIMYLERLVEVEVEVDDDWEVIELLLDTMDLFKVSCCLLIDSLLVIEVADAAAVIATAVVDFLDKAPFFLNTFIKLYSSATGFVKSGCCGCCCGFISLFCFSLKSLSSDSNLNVLDWVVELFLASFLFK